MNYMCECGAELEAIAIGTQINRNDITARLELHKCCECGLEYEIWITKNNNEKK